MKFQRGITLNGMLVGGAIVALLALVVMKTLPEWIEYGKIVKAVKAVSSDSSLKDASVAQVREAYRKKAELDDIKSLPPEDLEITKDEGRLTISFAYEKKVRLFHNVSLIFDFEGDAGK